MADAYIMISTIFVLPHSASISSIYTEPHQQLVTPHLLDSFELILDHTSSQPNVCSPHYPLHLNLMIVFA